MTDLTCEKCKRGDSNYQDIFCKICIDYNLWEPKEMEKETKFDKEAMKVVRGSNCNNCQNNSKLSFCMYCEQRGDLRDHYLPKPKLQKAFFTFKDKENDIIFKLIAHSEKNAEEFCKIHGAVLLDWPAKLDRIFEVDDV